MIGKLIKKNTVGHLPWLLLFVIGVPVFLSDCMHPKPTDYEKELAGIQNRISEIQDNESNSYHGQDSITTLVYFLYLKASVTGNYTDYKAVEETINRSLKQYGPSQRLYLARAHLNLKLHRLEAAKTDLDVLLHSTDSAQIKAVETDIALQEGQYEEALQGYEAIIKEKRTWDNLARLAYIRSKTGDAEDADALYREAQDLLSAKEMRDYAWLELQRGILDLEHKRYKEALYHYQHANKVYSGYWLIEEHIAKVLDLLGDTDKAIVIYKKIIERTNNPEFISTLAKFIARSDPTKAEGLYRQAETRFEQQFDLYPEAVLGHFITYLLDKKAIDPNLLKYALLNHQLRPNAESKFLLARAYSRINNEAQIQALFKDIAKTSWRPPEITAALEKSRVISKP